MIQAGAKACFMKDRKGYLPAHVACSRHCSPEKLQMLLNVNPASLFATTNDGHTLLSLATSTATKSHPNYALIDELRTRIDIAGTQQGHHLSLPAYDGGRNSNHAVPNRVISDDANDPADCTSDESRAAAATAAPAQVIESRKRKIKSEGHDKNKPDRDDKEQAHLLLHFYRQTDQQGGDQEIKNYATV
jgi:Ankyrin repeats (many copies)